MTTKLLSADMIGREWTRIIRQKLYLSSHPAFRTGLSQSHRRKLIKQRGGGVGETLSIRAPLRYAPAGNC